MTRVKKPATTATPAGYISAATANRKMNALRGLFTHAHERGIIAENPGEKLNKEDEGSGVVRWLKPDEEFRLRAALDDRENHLRANWMRINTDPRYNDVFEPHHTYMDYLKPAVLFALNTGLRRKEQLTLRWDDIDLFGRTVTVRSTKVNRTRVVPLCDEASEVISPWRAQCFQGNVRLLYVFPNAAGELMTDIRQWNDLRGTAKITSFRWHDLRHSFATRAVAHGVPLDLVSRWLGHSRIEQTMRYAHRDENFTTRAIAALDRASLEALQTISECVELAA